MSMLVSPHKRNAPPERKKRPRKHSRFALPASAVLVLNMLFCSPTTLPSQEPQPAASPAGATTAPPPQAPPAAPQQPAPAATPTSPAATAPDYGWATGVTEEGLRRQLVGKPLFLRGGYLGDSLSFDENGTPTGHPTTGSYTLSAVEIEKVHLTKHKVELEGARYALHFLGSMPYEDPSKGADRVKITPKKKVLKITIDRELVVKQKKIKEPKYKAPKTVPAPTTAESGSQPTPPSNEATKEPVASSETDKVDVAGGQPTPAKPSAGQPAASSPADADEEDDKPETGKNAEAERAASPQTQTRTISPVHAAKVLHDALDHVFAIGMDAQVQARMPEFWQLYYKAQAAGKQYRPSDPNVFRSNAVDQQAKITSSISPQSNEYAQANGIAGQALYRTVVQADGTPGEIAVVRPIGFGLDENAVAAIRKASFQPAMKGGQPVAESLDLVVLFRIYSNRTSEKAAESGDVTTETKPAVVEPVKPGPYTVQEQKAQQPPNQQSPN
jgi:TonB family protein